MSITIRLSSFDNKSPYLDDSVILYELRTCVYVHPTYEGKKQHFKAHHICASYSHTLMPVCIRFQIPCNIKGSLYFHSYNRYFMSHMPKHQNYWFTSNCTVQHKSSLFSCLLPISLFIDNCIWKNSRNFLYFLFCEQRYWEWNYILVFHHYMLRIICSKRKDRCYVHVVYWRCQMFVERNKKIEYHKRRKLNLHFTPFSERNQKPFYHRFEYGKITIQKRRAHKIVERIYIFHSTHL